MEELCAAGIAVAIATTGAVSVDNSGVGDGDSRVTGEICCEDHDVVGSDVRARASSR